MPPTNPNLPLDRKFLAEFCKRNQISKLALFGSALTNRFGPNSDIDILVEFDPDAKTSLFDVGGMMYELSQKAGRQVDIRTPEDLSRYFRSQVIKEAKVLYAS